MSRVEEIERAIQTLSPEEFQTISRWILEKQQEHWDKRLDDDSQAGRLDFLFEEADKDAREGRSREWPPQT